MEVLIILVVLFAVLGAGLVAWNSWRPRTPPTLKPGQFNELLPPKQTPKTPDQPTFIIRKPADAGFTEISRTGGQPAQRGAKTGPKTTAGQPNPLGTVQINLTAVCKLTGKQVADCTCDRCRDIKKKA